jgi:hypothetical protein
MLVYRSPGCDVHHGTAARIAADPPSSDCVGAVPVVDPQPDGGSRFGPGTAKKAADTTGPLTTLRPVTTLVAALIGVFGVLVGVAFTEWRRATGEKGLAKERLRGAARMISAELGIAAITVKSDRSFLVLGTLPSAAWQAHGADLARALSDDDFYAVVEAAAKVEAARSLGRRVTNPRAKVHGPPVEELAELGAICRHAQDVLRPLAYPDNQD